MKQKQSEAKFDELSKKQYFAWHPMKMNYFVSAKTLSFIMPRRARAGKIRKSKDKTSKKMLSCRGRNQSWWKFNPRWIGAWSQRKWRSEFITGRFAKTFEQIVPLRVQTSSSTRDCNGHKSIRTDRIVRTTPNNSLLSKIKAFVPGTRQGMTASRDRA